MSLVEAILATLLVAVVVLALAGGMLTMVGASGASSARQRTTTALTSFTESLKAIPYTDCTAGGSTPAPAAYQAVYDAWPGRWTPAADSGVSDRRIVRVDYWHPAAGTPPTSGEFRSTCPAGGDGGAQRLTVSVTVDGSTSRGQVVIRP